MSNTWKKFEEYTREVASVIWERPALPERISGVNFDAVIRISDEELVLIEITEEHSLEKVRGDITKIQGIKTNFALQGVFAKAFIVLSKEPTPGMVDMGRDLKVTVLSIDAFSRMALDYPSYINQRRQHSFGSAINPSTGEPDVHQYIPVKYTDQSGHKEYTTLDIANKLKKGEQIILLGEYGTGKSRCTKETFAILSSQKPEESPIALSINLREHWGQARQ